MYIHSNTKLEYCEKSLINDKFGTIKRITSNKLFKSLEIDKYQNTIIQVTNYYKIFIKSNGLQKRRSLMTNIHYSFQYYIYRLRKVIKKLMNTIQNKPSEHLMEAVNFETYLRLNVDVAMERMYSRSYRPYQIQSLLTKAVNYTDDYRKLDEPKFVYHVSSYIQQHEK